MTDRICVNCKRRIYYCRPLHMWIHEESKKVYCDLEIARNAAPARHIDGRVDRVARA